MIKRYKVSLKRIGVGRMLPTISYFLWEHRGQNRQSLRLSSWAASTSMTALFLDNPLPNPSLQGTLRDEAAQRP